MAVMVVVSVASFSANHWIWLSSPLYVFMRVSNICVVAVWMRVVILSSSVLRPPSVDFNLLDLLFLCVDFFW